MGSLLVAAPKDVIFVVSYTLIIASFLDENCLLLHIKMKKNNRELAGLAHNVCAR